MECLEVEDQIQFADIFEEGIESFDEDLDEIEKGERGFGRGRDEDEIEGRIVPVCDQGGSIVVLGV